MNIFQDLYRFLVYDPQINLLQLFYNITGDIGFAIISVAVFINLILWPFFASSYINSQKLRLLQPQLKKIREKYKNDQSELLKQTMEFNKKHKLNSGSVFWTLFVQLFFASGLFLVIRDAVNGVDISQNFYEFTSQLPRQDLDLTAFGFLPVQGSGINYVYLPLMTALLSFIYGMYTFKWSPKVKLPEGKNDRKKKDENSDKTDSIIDPEAFQKSMESNTIYVMPVILFFINYTWPVGLNIYILTVSSMSLIRQIFLTNFYYSHTHKLMEEIAKSDPQLDEYSEANNLVDNIEIAELADQPVPIVTVEKVDKKPVKKKSKKSKK